MPIISDSQRITISSEKYDLKINITKKKFIIISKKNVCFYKYIGTIINKNNDQILGVQISSRPENKNYCIKYLSENMLASYGVI